MSTVAMVALHIPVMLRKARLSTQDQHEANNFVGPERRDLRVCVYIQAEGEPQEDVRVLLDPVGPGGEIWGEDGCRLLDEGTQVLNEQAGSYADLAEVLSLAGRAQKAAEALEAALARYEHKGNLVMAGRMRDRLGRRTEASL